MDKVVFIVIPFLKSVHGSTQHELILDLRQVIYWQPMTGNSFVTFVISRTPLMLECPWATRIQTKN